VCARPGIGTETGLDWTGFGWWVLARVRVCPWMETGLTGPGYGAGACWPSPSMSVQRICHPSSICPCALAIGEALLLIPSSRSTSDLMPPGDTGLAASHQRPPARRGGLPASTGRAVAAAEPRGDSCAFLVPSVRD